MKYFTLDHWRATDGWKWNKKTFSFDTPTVCQLAVNVLYNETAMVMMTYQKMQSKNDAEKENEPAPLHDMNTSAKKSTKRGTSSNNCLLYKSSMMKMVKLILIKEINHH